MLDNNVKEITQSDTKIIWEGHQESHTKNLIAVHFKTGDIRNNLNG